MGQAAPLRNRRRYPLHRAPLFSVRQFDQLRDAITRIFGARRFDGRKDAARFQAISNCLWLDGLELGWMYSSGGYQYNAAPIGVVRQIFPISGAGRMSSHGQEIAIDGDMTAVVPVGAEPRLEFGDGRSDFRLRMHEPALRAKLGAMVGLPVVGRMVFEQSSSLRNPEVARLRRLIDHLVAECDAIPGGPPLQILAEYQQCMLVCFLKANRHNYSHLLDAAPSAAGPAQVRRAADYIEAHAAAPIPIETLADVSGVGALGLAEGFRREHGMSPGAFRAATRLRQARRMLMIADESLSVADVASRLGFGSTARLTAAYREAFGEQPWETLANARRQRH